MAETIQLSFDTAAQWNREVLEERKGGKRIRVEDDLFAVWA